MTETKRMTLQKLPHSQKEKLLSENKYCGVGFDVWEIRNPPYNKETGKYEFTILFGNRLAANLSSSHRKENWIGKEENHFCSCSLFPQHIQIFKNIHWAGGRKNNNTACVPSVSMGFQSKKRPKNGIFFLCFSRPKNWGENKP